MRYMKITMLIIIALFVVMGCPKKQVTPPPPEEVIVEEVPVVEPEPPKPEFKLNRIFFDFDKSDIRADAAEILKKNAEMLKIYSDVSISIEGHCCRIGTAEYNLALGERRAKAAREYLIGLGISSKRLSTVSYGEEKPLDPNDLPKNRRCEFVRLTK
jgi:peptidoglycan-associated lipoprotein